MHNQFFQKSKAYHEIPAIIMKLSQWWFVVLAFRYDIIQRDFISRKRVAIIIPVYRILCVLLKNMIGSNELEYSLSTFTSYLIPWKKELKSRLDQSVITLKVLMLIPFVIMKNASHFLGEYIELEWFMWDRNVLYVLEQCVIPFLGQTRKIKSLCVLKMKFIILFSFQE